ncbi:hypothetical protein C8J57DRAFT_1287202 [Mycena rebaudengoi]|nr:hypothetical protein C8J57DRAFT_1287202 [Mycena rebaudengoi]
MDGDCLPQTVLKSMRTHCPRFDSVSLFLLNDFETFGEDIEATFALEGLKHLTINSLQISPSEGWMDSSLPPSIIKALRASPALETLHLAVETEWNVHQTFAELRGAHVPHLRALSLRKCAELDCWKLCEATDPFLQFLHAHHAQLETLALPISRSTFAFGPAELRLPVHFFPALTAFEGPGFLCRRLSELPHPAARLPRGVGRRLRRRTGATARHAARVRRTRGTLHPPNGQHGAHTGPTARARAGSTEPHGADHECGCAGWQLGASCSPTPITAIFDNTNHRRPTLLPPSQRSRTSRPLVCRWRTCSGAHSPSRKGSSHPSRRTARTCAP